MLPTSPPLERLVRFWLVVLALLVAAGWARLANHRNVFTEQGVELQPTDSHYYVRFAQLQRESFPRFVDHDSFVNHPLGARILWPPVHTWAVAATIAVLEPEHPERSAAWVGPWLALLETGLLVLLVRRAHGEGITLAFLFLWALTPVSVFMGAVGNVDHHLHEPFLVVLVVLGTGQLLHKVSWRWALFIGLTLGVGRLLTPSSFPLIPVAAGALVLTAALRREQAKTLARLGLYLGLGSAGGLMVGVLVFGQVRPMQYEQLSAFHPLFALACLAFASALCGLFGCERRWAAGGAVAGLLSGLPLLPELGRACNSLLRADPLLELVTESQPLLRHPDWAWHHLGIAALLFPIALLGLTRRMWRERAVSLVPLWVATLALTGAALLQLRFLQPLMGALALVIPLGLEEWLRSTQGLARRALGGAMAVCGLTLFTSLMSSPPDSTPSDEALVRSTLTWMKAHTPAPGNPPTYGVVATHDLGHLLTLWAERPAVATPFSQAPWHQEGNLRAANILAAEDDEQAYQLARAAGARYVLVIPFQHILGHPMEDDSRTLARRLLDYGGLAPGEPTAHFRRVFDSPQQRLRPEGGSYARLFEVVPGARLVGKASPGSWVEGRLDLLGNADYWRRVRADASGNFVLTVAYPGQYLVSIEGSQSPLEVSERAVRLAEAVPLQ